MRPQPNPTDKHRLIALLTPVSWVILSLLWTYAIILYRSLPTQIAIQFDFSGKVIRYGHKGTLFLLPVISSFIVLGMSNKPRVEHLRGSNTSNGYIQAGFTAYLKLAMMLLGFIILYHIKHIADAPESGWAGWMIPVFVLLMIAPVFILLTNKGR
jgi:uncharacterized membrane protein